MELSKSKLKWATSRANSLKGILRSTPINKNKVAEHLYLKSMKLEYDRFIKKVFAMIEDNYSTTAIITSSKAIERGLNDLQSSYLSKNRTIINRWLKVLKKDGKKSILSKLSELQGKNISINFDKRFERQFKLLAQDNADLIKNATDQLKQNVKSITTNNIINGIDFKDGFSSLKNQYGITNNRLRLIARDQTAKANESLNQLMQQESGAEFWQWVTVEDERTSTGYGGHKDLNGKIYSYNEPENYPIIDSYGNRGIPSVRPNCRCTSVAVYILDGYKAVKQSDGSYLVVKK